MKEKRKEGIEGSGVRREGMGGEGKGRERCEREVQREANGEREEK